ncbi:MAG: DUF3078 domain-containing protein [Bacteroidales bacterium]|nr:DUF3078 domain-containing protein [Bacteroidales bacterium]
MKKQYSLLAFIFILGVSFLHAQEKEMLNVTKKAKEMTDLTKKAKELSSLVGDSPVEKKTWSFGAGFQLTVSQAYSKNWVGSANPSVGGTIVGNAFAKYAHNRLAWENTLDITYGERVTFNPKPPKGIGTKMEKLSDRLDFKSKFGYKAGGNWFYGAMFTWTTQLTNGYDKDNDTLLVSSFMTPGYITLSLGMDYKREKWSWYISPIGTKLVTKVHNKFIDVDKDGVLAGKKLYASIGASTHLVFAADIHPKVNLNTKLELFYDYLGEYKQLRNLDVRFDMVWMFRITDWLSLSLTVAALYDYDVKFNCYDADGKQRYVEKYKNRVDKELVPLQTDHLQFQEFFGLTLGYSFKTPKK